MSQRPDDVLYKELEGFVLVFTGMVNALCLCKNRICNRLLEYMLLCLLQFCQVCLWKKGEVFIDLKSSFVFRYCDSPDSSFGIFFSSWCLFKYQINSFFIHLHVNKYATRFQFFPFLVEYLSENTYMYLQR